MIRRAFWLLTAALAAVMVGTAAGSAGSGVGNVPQGPQSDSMYAQSFQTSGVTTGEDTGASAPYPTQAGSNPGSPMSGPQLVKDHSESDLRVDPVNQLHL